MGQGDLPKLLALFMGDYPGVSLSLHLSNRQVDMAEEAIDLALRAGPTEDDNLIVRKLTQLKLVVCASPHYRKKRGKPAHPAEPDPLRAEVLLGQATDVLTACGAALWTGAAH